MPEYSDASPAGGNPLAVDVNAQYSGLEFHWVYQIIQCYFVFMIIPGLGTSQRTLEVGRLPKAKA